ncbi:hypothetical protein [Sorangium sp. So ce131]|uniref:hypothetical protein n=1 Tax=Sorangium sp. So ce131 TaxID=3133282 RepID=UPI003F5F6284
MIATERDRLRREASAMKMRAMRLRALGDVDDQWNALVLLRAAARKELAALAAQSAPSEQEEVGARVEACGLFLDARDPVRAAEQWARLPRWAFLSSPGAAMLDALRPVYKETIADFHAAWHEVSRPPGLQAEIRKIRALRDKYPGVAELWWALAKRSTNVEERGLSRARMAELEPSFEHDAVADEAWKRVGDKLVSLLRIEMHAERKGSVLALDLVSRIAAVFSDLFGSFVDRTFNEHVELTPRGATTGSFILDVSALGMPPHSLEELNRILTEAPEQAGTRKLMELLSLLQNNGVRFGVAVIADPDAAADGHRRLEIDAKRRRALIGATEEAALRALDSRDIPQADVLSRIFDIVDRIARGEEVNAHAMEITQRQVVYYRQATRILGLLTESDELTAAGRLIARLRDEKDRLRATVVYFESSVCGDAWIRWSRGNTLLDVDPETAPEFLRASVPGLNGQTRGRRAQTLIAWHRELVEYHYAR